MFTHFLNARTNFSILFDSSSKSSLAIQIIKTIYIIYFIKLTALSFNSKTGSDLNTL